ncbi:MAG TPA: hypothetical protein VHY08_16975 [Bacillota bacterium]|nr:hypothetical protein [Bacillota bacterium]
MTTRERNLLAIVGVVMILGLGFNYLMNRSSNTEIPDSGNTFALDEATRLLKSSRNLESQSQVVAGQLDALEDRFFSLKDPDQAKIKLMIEVEKIAAETHLMIEQKQPNIPFPNNVIGVLIAGKSAPDSIYLFMQKITLSKSALKISKLQLHSIEEQRLIDFQMVVVSLLIEKRKEK